MSGHIRGRGVWHRRIRYGVACASGWVVGFAGTDVFKATQGIDTVLPVVASIWLTAVFGLVVVAVIVDMGRNP